MKILAIDDQKLVLIPLEIRLKELGYEIITETSALKGMELFNSFQPDLVIVDINMQETSGIDVIKYIRQKRNSEIPIMILSGIMNIVVSIIWHLIIFQFGYLPLNAYIPIDYHVSQWKQRSNGQSHANSHFDFLLKPMA